MKMSRTGRAVAGILLLVLLVFGRQAPAAAAVDAQQDKLSFMYYSQLSKEEQSAYRALARTDLLKRPATWRVKRTFYTSLAIANDWEYSLRYHREIYPLLAEAERAIYAYRLDYMDRTYWIHDIDIQIPYEIIQKGDSKRVQVVIRSLTFVPLAYSSRYQEDDPRVKKAVSKLAGTVKKERKDKSRYETLKKALSLMVRDMSYGNLGSEAAYSAAAVLLASYGKTGTCEAYARCLFLLCRKLKIPVVYMESEDHAFCYVRMENNKWYGIDPVWADKGKKMDARWFLYGREAAKKNDTSLAHTPLLRRNSISLEPIQIAKKSYRKK